MLYSILLVKVVNARTKELAHEFCRATQGKIRASRPLCRRRHPQFRVWGERGTEEQPHGDRVDLCTRIKILKTKLKKRRISWLVTCTTRMRLAGAQILVRKVMTLRPSLHDLAVKLEDTENLCRVLADEARSCDRRIQRNEEIVGNAIMEVEMAQDGRRRYWVVQAVLSGIAATSGLIYGLSELWRWVESRRKGKEIEGDEATDVEKAETKELEARHPRLHARALR